MLSDEHPGGLFSNQGDGAPKGVDAISPHDEMSPRDQKNKVIYITIPDFPYTNPTVGVEDKSPVSSHGLSRGTCLRRCSGCCSMVSSCGPASWSKTKRAVATAGALLAVLALASVSSLAGSFWTTAIHHRGGQRASHDTPLHDHDGSCTGNAADASIWYGHGGARRFGWQMHGCGQTCWGGEACVAYCFSNKGDSDKQLGYGATVADVYSRPCAACMGRMAACTKDNCFWQCAIAGSSNPKGCQDCSVAKCRPAFLVCTGFSANDFPRHLVHPG